MEALLRSMQRTMENFVEFMKVTAEAFESLGKVIAQQQSNITMLEFWCAGLSVLFVALTIWVSHHIFSAKK
jgi:hypothetical protein